MEDDYYDPEDNDNVFIDVMPKKSRLGMLGTVSLAIECYARCYRSIDADRVRIWFKEDFEMIAFHEIYTASIKKK